MPRSSYGPAVIDGEVQYFSASSLTLGDSDSSEGCLRKYWYEKVEGRKAPSTDAQELGTRLHSEIETYLRTGINELGALAARGKPMIPAPGPDLFIEHDLLLSPADEMVARDAEQDGRNDVAAQLRGRATLATAPLRILDIPVVGYIDLLHGRCTNKGVADIEDIHDPEGTVEVIDWKTTSKADYIKTSEAMARTIQMTVYGKWVSTVFPAASHIRLSHGYFITRGTGAPRKVTQRLTPEQIDRQWERVERVAVSIVDAARERDVDKVPANTRACDAYGGCPHRSYCRAGAQEALAAFFGITSADDITRRLNNVPSTSLNIASRQKPDSNLQAEMLRVGREEIELKYPGLPATWDALEACNVGNPQYAGELARVVGELIGSPTPVTRVEGKGKLAEYGPFSDPVELAALLEEVQIYLMPVELAPPDVPSSDPALASKSSSSELVPVKRGRGRPKKVSQDTTGPVAEQTVMTFVAPPLAMPAVEDTLYFYVNCAPSRKHESFWPVVQELIVDLNKASEPALDFRLVPNEHKFAYGRWKAAIAAALTTCELAPGHYVLDGVGGEVGMAVVEAMRVVVTARGGVFVQ